MVDLAHIVQDVAKHEVRYVLSRVVVGRTPDDESKRRNKPAGGYRARNFLLVEKVADCLSKLSRLFSCSPLEFRIAPALEIYLSHVPFSLSGAHAPLPFAHHARFRTLQIFCN